MHPRRGNIKRIAGLFRHHSTLYPRKPQVLQVRQAHIAPLSKAAPGDVAVQAESVAGCFCARMPETVRPDKTYILVENTRTALRDLAGWYRGQFNIPVVQIASRGRRRTSEQW